MKNTNQKASINLINGINETSIKEIRISRSKDGKKGNAIIIIENPKAFNNSQLINIKEMHMNDEEGELISKEINIQVKNSNQKSISAVYRWNSESEFQRFIRFAINYSNTNKNNYKE